MICSVTVEGLLGLQTSNQRISESDLWDGERRSDQWWVIGLSVCKSIVVSWSLYVCLSVLNQWSILDGSNSRPWWHLSCVTFHWSPDVFNKVHQRWCSCRYRWVNFLLFPSLSSSFSFVSAVVFSSSSFFLNFFFVFYYVSFFFNIFIVLPFFFFLFCFVTFSSSSPSLSSVSNSFYLPLFSSTSSSFSTSSSSSFSFSFPYLPSSSPDSSFSSVFLSPSSFYSPHLFPN